MTSPPEDEGVAAALGAATGPAVAIVCIPSSGDSRGFPPRQAAHLKNPSPPPKLSRLERPDIGKKR